MPQTLRLGYEQAKLGYIYQMYAMNLGIIAEETDHNFSKSEEVFKQGLEAMAPEEELHSYGEGLFLRFHYAALLAKADPVGRKQDIIDMLNRMTQPRPVGIAGKYLAFDEFVKNEASSSHDTHSHKKDLLRLSAISPAFKAYLSSEWGIRIK